MASYSFECRRDGGGAGDLFVPTVLDVAGTRHIIPRRGGQALCGAESVLSTEAASTSHRPELICPRCRQRHARAALEREGVSTGWEGRDAD